MVTRRGGQGSNQYATVGAASGSTAAMPSRPDLKAVADAATGSLSPARQRMLDRRVESAALRLSRTSTFESAVWSSRSFPEAGPMNLTRVARTIGGDVVSRSTSWAVTAFGTDHTLTVTDRDDHDPGDGDTVVTIEPDMTASAEATGRFAESMHRAVLTRGDANPEVFAAAVEVVDRHLASPSSVRTMNSTTALAWMDRFGKNVRFLDPINAPAGARAHGAVMIDEPATVTMEGQRIHADAVRARWVNDANLTGAPLVAVIEVTLPLNAPLSEGQERRWWAVADAPSDMGIGASEEALTTGLLQAVDRTRSDQPVGEITEAAARAEFPDLL